MDNRQLILIILVCCRMESSEVIASLDESFHVTPTEEAAMNDDNMIYRHKYVIICT